jgi:hypothetical protein
MAWPRSMSGPRTSVMTYAANIAGRSAGIRSRSAVSTVARGSSSKSVDGGRGILSRKSGVRKRNESS